MAVLLGCDSRATVTGVINASGWDGVGIYGGIYRYQ